MNTALQNSAQAFLSRYEGLRDRLPGERDARDAAAEMFRNSGLPHVRNEAWRYTSLRPLTELSFYEPLTEIGGSFAGRDEALVARLPSLDASRIVFVDGRFRPEFSDVPDGVPVTSFGQAATFGVLARPDREPMVALNTMLAEDGAVIDVPAGVDAGTLLLASIATDLPNRAVTFHPRHTVRLGEGARLAILEVAIGAGSYLHNPVTEVTVQDGAVLTHVRLQDEAAGAFHLATIYADVAAAATYDFFLLALGARLSRTEVHSRLHGERGTVHLNGAQLLGGSQHADFTTIVRHDAPSCASRQTVKNVLSDRSRGVFQGRIEVARVAQKTDGYQMNQTLLLSPEAEVNSKPQLEIYADDVKCSHGATIGELDTEQLFYLRSRGIPDDRARSILVRAFLSEALDPIGHEPMRQALEAAVETWWDRVAA